MRLSDLRKVDLPQPLGPMMAVTFRAEILIVMVLKRLALSVPHAEVPDVERDLLRLDGNVGR
jgi:hypothetical protein